MAIADKFTFRKHASIGAAAAEEDARFLADCFVDNGDLEPLLDCSDRRRIILGRTGAGKSALLAKLVEDTNAIVINPESLAFNFITNSTIAVLSRGRRKVRSFLQATLETRLHG